jgi:transcriptional regulator with XRE-family HTH domain
MRSELGQVILKIQAEKNISNLDLAEKMGTLPQNVAKLKTRNSLQPKTLHRLAKALGVEVDIFLKVIR